MLRLARTLQRQEMFNKLNPSEGLMNGVLETWRRMALIVDTAKSDSRLDGTSEGINSAICGKPS